MGVAFGLDVSHACGDKLAALGGGVSFKRVMAAPHRGDILLYLSTGSQLETADVELGLRKALEQAGHRVRAVRDETALAAALASAKPDLLLMDWSAVSHYRGNDASAPGGIAVLGVRYRDAPEGASAAADSSGCTVDAGKRKGRQLLNTVSELLEQKGKGRQCHTSA